MKKIFISIIVLMVWFQAHIIANPFGWADTIGGKGYSHGNAIVVDKNNNLFVCGQMDGSFQPTNVKINGKNNFLIKYSSQGSVLWAKPLPGLVCQNLCIGANSNVCVVGYFSDTVHFGKLTLVNAGLNDFFILKFDSLGNLLWGTSGGGNGNDYALSVSCDIAGNTNITGSFESYIDFNPYTSLLSLGKGDMFVAQYDSAGNFVWAANGGGNGADAGTAIGSDFYGDVFVTGYFNKTATFHNNKYQSNGGNNMFIAKYSPQGYQLYVHTVSCGGSVTPNAMSLDGSGNVYIVGTFNGSAIFDDKIITSSGNDGFLAAYDNSLDINWLKQMGGSGNDVAIGISADWESNIFVTGVFTGTANFDATSLTSKGGTDIFIVKYDAAGRVLWNQRAGGQGADSALSVCYDRNDIPTITGIINTDADFGAFTLNANDSGSFFVAQMKPNPSGIDMPNSNVALFDIYPNPSPNIFNIKGLGDNLVLMNLTDAEGRMVSVSKSFPNQLNLQNYPNGIYFLTVETRNGRQTEKLVKTGN